MKRGMRRSSRFQLKRLFSLDRKLIVTEQRRETTTGAGAESRGSIGSQVLLSAAPATILDRIISPGPCALRVRLLQYHLETPFCFGPGLSPTAVAGWRRKAERLPAR